MLKSLPILGKFFSKKNSKEELFLALEISEDKKVKVAIWEAKEKNKILKQAIEEFDGKWEEVISSITQLVLNLTKEANLEGKVQRVIFGLPKSFVDKEKIKPSHQAHLKKICQELSLTPLGFVEIPHAIAHLLKEKEGRPQTAILLKAADSSFSFNVFKTGKEIGGKTISYEKNLSLHLAQSLKDFSDLQTFPTKIFLYNDKKDLEEVKQELLSFPWQKEAGFLHFPKIEILDEDFSLLAIIAAGTSEFTKGLPQIPEKEVSDEKKIVEKEEVSSQSMGFIKDEDVAEAEDFEDQEEIQEEILEKEVEKEIEEETEEEIEEEKETAIMISEEKVVESKPGFLFSLKQTINSFFANMSFRPKFKRIAFLLIFLTIVLGGFIFNAFWLSPRATLLLLVEPHTLEEDAEIVLSLLDEALEEDSSQISGKLLTVERTASEKISVSSTKDVGEPARGEVTIYNKTTNTKSFAKGTIITGPKGLKFTLDKDVSIASLSDVIAGTPGKEKVQITAEKIGPEGNLGSGSDFTFEDLPVTSYAARNDKTFSGGTSREVTVVGEKDQEELLALLEKKLIDKSKEEFEKKITSSEKLLVETIEGKTLEKKFSHDVGEETDELNLDLVMSFTGASYNEDDLGALLRKMAEESAPDGFKFDKEEVEMEVTSIEKEEDKILFNAHFKVKLIPEIDVEELKEKLTGKGEKEVEEYLRTFPNISGFEIEFDSSPPLMKKSLPFNSQKISIEISTP
ncbi:baseplate J/gp47 family protein [Candidatus Microgenomates bacterium]|nr:baseplate J/gp47 family protein [Candidatus Microgenomates bacterium]